MSIEPPREVLVRPTTRTRVDLGLRLPDRDPSTGGRLVAATSIGSDAVNVRVALAEAADVDDEMHDLLRAAYAANA